MGNEKACEVQLTSRSNSSLILAHLFGLPFLNFGICQIDGVAMRSPLGPVLVNILMCDFQV